MSRLFAAFLALAVASIPAFAQNQGLIVRDGSLGQGTNQPVAPGSGADYFIEDAFGLRLGPNLLHSFRLFGVGDAETATFELASQTNNVVVRVTGIEASSIDGTIRFAPSTQTNLFVLNPNGIFIGPNAFLATQGAFHFGASTALEFEAGELFEAAENGAVPALGVDPIASFGFLQGASGTVHVSGARLEPRTDLTLTGVDIRVDQGAVLAPRPLFAAQEGDVRLLATGDVTITDRSTSVGQERRTDQTGLVQRVREVFIHGDTVRIADGSVVNASTYPAQGTPHLAGRIRISADSSILVEGSSDAICCTRVEGLQTDTAATPDGPRIGIDLAAPHVAIRGNATVSTSTGAPSSAGDITISGERIELDAGARVQSNSVVRSFDTPPGAAGSIVLAADRVAISDGATLSSSTDTTGGSGSVEVVARVIDVSGGVIETVSTMADGGDVRLTADERVSLRSARLSASVAGGDGGSVRIGTPAALVAQDGTQILADANVLGGRGGRIELAGEAIVLEAGTRIDASAPGGPDAQGSVVIRGPEQEVEPSAAPLPVAWLPTERLLTDACTGPSAAGSFTVAGVVPERPDALPSAGTEPLLAVAELAEEARAALSLGRVEEAAALLERANREISGLDAASAVPVALHLARSYLEMARHRERRIAGLRAANELAERVVRIAEASGARRARVYALGLRGALYEDEGRDREALHLTRQALAAAGSLSPDPSLYEWQWQEGRLLWRMGEREAALAAYRSAVRVAQETRVASGSSEADGAPRRSELYKQLADLLVREPVGDPLPRLAEVRSLSDQLRLSEIREYFRDECLAALGASRVAAHQVSRTAAIVHLLALPDRLEILVSVGDSIARYTDTVSAEELEQTLREFRVALQKRFSRQYLAPARQLYAWLVAPYAKDLADRGVDTLVFATDPRIGVIPFAALHDGSAFLAERYATALDTGAGLEDPRPLRIDDADLLMAGLTEAVDGRDPLPYVQGELGGIAERYGGRVLVDDAFRRKKLVEEIERNPPQVLHIASHASFGGDSRSSYIETRGGRLGFDDLAQIASLNARRQRPVELLVLSACETAVGDGEATLGLLGAALRAGARSGLGSLWIISDQATSDLMAAFYRDLGDPRLTKARALQRAQQELIANASYEHPYYWAGFVLASNWL